jgi:hypothetical protein
VLQGVWSGGGGSWVAEEDVVKGVWGMSVGEGFMTRRAVALELICVLRVMSPGSCSYMFGCKRASRFV